MGLSQDPAGTPACGGEGGQSSGTAGIPGKIFYMIYSYYRYFGALAVIKVQHLRQNKSKNLPTTLKREESNKTCCA